MLYLDPASDHAASDHADIAQVLDPYGDICSLGNHNKDSILRSVNGTSLCHFFARSQIRSTNQYVVLCKHDHLQ